VPGIVTEQPASSEQNPRALYKRWAEYMDTDSWDELLDAQKTPLTAQA
jgi:hypothetical protein